MEDQNKIVNNMVDNLILSFEEKTPREIMKTTAAPSYMYNAAMRLLYRLSKVCNISKETVKKHIDLIWDSGTKPQRILN